MLKVIMTSRFGHPLRPSDAGAEISNLLWVVAIPLNVVDD